MLRLGLVGISIHHAPLELLSALTISREERAERLPLLAEACGFEELAYVATCNRVEFLFKAPAAQSIARSRNLILDYFFRAQKSVPFQPEHFYTHTGIRIVRDWSASALVIACLIHHVAYVENLNPLV